MSRLFLATVERGEVAALLPRRHHYPLGFHRNTAKWSSAIKPTQRLGYLSCGIFSNAARLVTSSMWV